VVVVAVIWLFLIDHGPPSLSAEAIRVLAALVPAYFILELFLFCLHWIFVSERIASSRRSLALFCFNLFELAFLFSIIHILVGCANEPSVRKTVYANLSSVFGLSLVSTPSAMSCSLISHTELVVSVTLVMVVIAGLVGTIVPPDKGDDPRFDAI
jgi:hypothetical protein